MTPAALLTKLLGPRKVATSENIAAEQTARRATLAKAQATVAAAVPPAPVVLPEVAADRVRVLAIRAAMPPGAEAERDRAIASGESVETFRKTLAVREVEAMLRWARGGSKD